MLDYALGVAGYGDMAIVADLQRFLDAQSPVYGSVLNELRIGRKHTHWMWFVFPQAVGLGTSETSIYYSIRSFEDALCYLGHPVLGARLVACTELVNRLNGASAVSVFGATDAIKFRSSMSLFSIVDPLAHVFRRALDSFYNGIPDAGTIRIVSNWKV